MTTLTAAAAERVGPGFSVDGMLAARQATRQALRDISARIRPGMVEEDAVALARSMLVEAGMQLSWHPTRVRFGANTLKAMKQASTPGVVLGDNDLFFLDIAPRVGAFEGDGGASFTVGHAPEQARCARDAQALFHELRQAWHQEELTGQALYERGMATAQAMGWRLNLDLPGHRVSEFPHAAIHTGSLAAYELSPSPLRWVLEIHLLDPLGRFGAFFEDMLLDDAHYA